MKRLLLPLIFLTACQLSPEEFYERLDQYQICQTDFDCINSIYGSVHIVHHRDYEQEVKELYSSIKWPKSRDDILINPIYHPERYRIYCTNENRCDMDTSNQPFTPYFESMPDVKLYEKIGTKVKNRIYGYLGYISGQCTSVTKEIRQYDYLYSITIDLDAHSDKYDQPIGAGPLVVDLGFTRDLDMSGIESQYLTVHLNLQPSKTSYAYFTVDIENETPLIFIENQDKRYGYFEDDLDIIHLLPGTINFWYQRQSQSVYLDEYIYITYIWQHYYYDDYNDIYLQEPYDVLVDGSSYSLYLHNNIQVIDRERMDTVEQLVSHMSLIDKSLLIRGM